MSWVERAMGKGLYSSGDDVEVLQALLPVAMTASDAM